MSRTKTKRYLMLLAAVGLIAAGLGGTGTFASFNAETTNGGNVFATGTLFLHNTAGVQTCKSEDDAGNVRTSDCATLFDNLPLENGTAQSALVTLKNDGTLDASDIVFGTAPACVGGDNHLVTLSNKIFGIADVCPDLQFAIEELDGITGTTPGAVVGCAYGTQGTLPTDGCVIDGTRTLATTGTHTLSLAADLNSNTGSQLSSKQTRYFRIEVKPVAATDNTFQNRKVTFGLTWHIDEAT
jgi:predicted ribosomally synthesized peptide with SipW-like signal peptide